MLTLLKSFVMISLCPIIILSPSFSQTSQTRRPGFYDLLRVLFQSQRKVGTLFGFIMMNSSTNNLGGRIPASLQAVFLASNRGHEVNTPPPRKVAFKTFSYILNLKSKRRQYEKQGSKKAEVPTPVVVKVSWSTRRGTGRSTSGFTCRGTGRSTRGSTNDQALKCFIHSEPTHPSTPSLLVLSILSALTTSIDD
jgi:hypothetical protein